MQVIDILITVVLTLMFSSPIVSIITILFISSGNTNHDNEMYMDGYIAGRNDALHGGEGCKG